MRKILFAILSLSLLASCSSVKSKRHIASAKEDALLNCPSKKWEATYNMRIVDREKLVKQEKVDPKLLEISKKLKRDIINHDALMREIYTSPFPVKFEFEQTDRQVTGSMFLGLRKLPVSLTCDPFELSDYPVASGENVLMKDVVVTGCTFSTSQFSKEVLVNIFHVSEDRLVPYMKEDEAGFSVFSEPQSIINAYFFNPKGGNSSEQGATYESVGMIIDFLYAKTLTCKQ